MADMKHGEKYLVQQIEIYTAPRVEKSDEVQFVKLKLHFVIRLVSIP